jgi:hypothetical protein
VKEISGTSFVLTVEGKAVLVTNRHMVDLNFGRTDAKYIGFTLRHLLCEVRARDENDGNPGQSRSFNVPMTHNKVLFDSNLRNDVAINFDIQSANLDGTRNRHWEYCFKFSDLATEEELRTELQPFDLLAFPGFPEGFDKRGLRAIIRGGTVRRGSDGWASEVAIRNALHLENFRGDSTQLAPVHALQRFHLATGRGKRASLA